jgi:hypothetical protein
MVNPNHRVRGRKSGQTLNEDKVIANEVLEKENIPV